jgi:AcrR family transcriptional regulator
MAIKERKERERQDMRNLIIDSATQLFLQHGYDKTSIRNIADDIEYSPATIYLYFKDKDEIFYVIHENGFALLDKELRKNDVFVDPFERLRGIGRTYIKFAVENPDFYDLMFIMWAPLYQIKCEKQWKAGECAFGYLVETIGHCLEQKMIKPADTFLLAISVWSFFHGMVSLHVRGRISSLVPMTNDAIEAMLDTAVENYLEVLRA